MTAMEPLPAQRAWEIAPILKEASRDSSAGFLTDEAGRLIALIPAGDEKKREVTHGDFTVNA